MPRGKLLSLLAVLSLAAVARADRTTVGLVADRTAVEPGGEVTVAVVYTIEPKWHIYWMNPGDTGAPPSVSWDLPPGVTARSPRFPVPTRLNVGNGLTAFGYEDAAALLTRIKVSADAKDAIDLKASVSTVVCAGECEFEHASVSLHLPIGTGKPNAADRFAAWQAAMPKPSGKAIVATMDDATRVGTLDVPLPEGSDAVDFFAPPVDSVIFDKPSVVSKGTDRVYRLTFKVPPGMSLPRDSTGLVETRRAGGSVEAAEVDFRFPRK